MAQYSTEALVIGVKNWGEADKLITLLSPEKGRIKATAFGCRRPKSPLAAGLQLFNVVEVQLTVGERLDTVRQCSVKQTFRSMSQDFVAMAYGSFVAELVGHLAIENFPQVELYKQISRIFTAFGSRNPRIIALGGAFQLLEASGMQLNYTHCCFCGSEIVGDAVFSIASGGAVCLECKKNIEDTPIQYLEPVRIFIGQLLAMDWSSSEGGMSVKGTHLMAAESILLLQLQHILGKPLKSLEFLQQL